MRRTRPGANAHAGRTILILSGTRTFPNAIFLVIVMMTAAIVTGVIFLMEKRHLQRDFLVLGDRPRDVRLDHPRSIPRLSKMPQQLARRRLFPQFRTGMLLVGCTNLTGEARGARQNMISPRGSEPRGHNLRAGPEQ